MKTLALALATIGLFATSTAQASLADLSSWTTVGNASASTEQANLTAYGTISSKVSNVTSFDWFFQAKDYMPFNDYGWYRLDSGAINVLSNVSAVGDYGNSGWQTFIFDTAFTGTLTFGVNNEMDTGLSSELYIKNVESASKVPEPVSLSLVAMGLAGLGLSRRKARQAA
ncbi:PEP-CTERM sorting domain-containing protein [Zoogloea sp.]|uniref:PEP-CTERM sorting domain-containing protein n=1 Tax=Zoogloea sp. TaxID=49181 RepID=UPI002636A469|nr:PEP-CTERM sorting domain-containing protein [Zoogloea sp.]MDD3355180.1 PEP-CTERM sorting domain-containing protein [Zoogloea sp.]